MKTRLLLLGLALAVCVSIATPVRAADPLSSWNEGPVKKAITDFVEAVTDPKNDSFVEPSERIATFDNDGCLWVEQPMYTQLAFVRDRVVALAPEHPEWKTQQPFQALLAGDLDTVAESGEKGLLELVMATHSGMTVTEFTELVEKWLAGQQHPRFKRLYTELVYQPQLELLAYLRANGFKTFIVSGGGIEFMRPFTEEVYGVPPEQVVGSSIVTEFKIVDGRPVLLRLPKLHFIDDKAGKPVGINQHIGRRPIMAVGNSDGDIQMLQYTKAGSGRSLAFLVHHTDAEREYAYDRESHVGRLARGLDEHEAGGWLILDMKRDWKRIFPFE
jgi:phosphoglycolate phosphatase-like HAD superfamily hydrolase